MAGIVLLGMSVYAAIKTSRLRYVEWRKLPVGIAAGTSVVVGLGSATVSLVMVLIGMAIAVFALIAVFYFLRALLSTEENKD